MRWKPFKSDYPLLMMAVFAAGLVLAGVLLYRWINRASIADREQQVEFLNAAMRSFRGELLTPLLEIRSTFRPVPRAVTTADLEQYLAGFYSQWRSTDANGALVSSLSLATLDADGKLQYRTLDIKTGKFNPEPWPESLEFFRPRVENIARGEAGRMFFFRAGGFPFALNGTRPMIVVPLMAAGEHGRGYGFWAGRQSEAGPGPATEVFTEREVRRRGTQPPGGGPHFDLPARPMFPGRLRGWCFLELDVGYLEQHVFPQLMERSFGGAGLANYKVAVLGGEPQQVIFSSEPGLTPSAFSSPDGDALLLASYGGLGALFRVRTRRLVTGAGPDEHAEEDLSVERIRPVAPEVTLPRGFEQRRFPEASVWVLAVKNKAGSIDALVATTRRRNLALGFGVLFLLAFSMGSLVFSTHRARELARREMEFVAGVSHEFRTPLASIQSAGFNLSSGVVKESGRVREYGALVQNEARRLTDLIEQVMSYAGIQSGGKHYEIVATEVQPIVDRALADSNSSIHADGWQIEKHVEENLPPVLAEPSSLESAVRNLCANAIKYGGAGRWLRVTAARASENGRHEVQISVEDRGPGIDPADLPHIFEPFYRGQGVLASTVPGAGLGLSIVKQHIEAQGGRVSVESTKGKGSRFTLHLRPAGAAESKTV